MANPQTLRVKIFTSAPQGHEIPLEKSELFVLFIS
jgi:hypothetical protein